MPAKKDFTVWVEVEGDHADDATYQRQSLNPVEPPTDERQTAEAAKGDDD